MAATERIQTATRALLVTVNHDRCVGSTLCVQVAAPAFALNEDGQSSVRDAPSVSEAEILNAAEQCPQEAIKVLDAQTREQLFP